MFKPYFPGPPTIDFGEVCLKSVSQKDLNICNNLDQYIHVVVHVSKRKFLHLCLSLYLANDLKYGELVPLHLIFLM